MALNLKLVDETKEMKKIIFLYQEFHPKDVSRCALQMIYRETYGPVFEDLMGVFKVMVASQKPSDPNQNEGFQRSPFKS